MDRSHAMSYTKKEANSPFMSNTVAPPANAPIFDIEKEFGDMTMRPGKTMHIPSAYKVCETTRQKSYLYSSRLGESSGQLSSRAQSNTISKGVSKQVPLSSVKEDPPPVYKTNISNFSRGDGRSPQFALASSKREERSRAPSSVSKSKVVSSSRAQNERSSYPADKKDYMPSSTRQQSDHEHWTQLSNSHARSNADQSSEYSRHRQPKGSSTSHHRSQPTAHVRTSHYPMGDMTRTVLEGMVPISEYEAAFGGNKTYTKSTEAKFRSMAPATARTILTNPEDVEMASRQVRIETLPPDERKKQESWAQSLIQRTGVCPEGFAWRRIRGAYQCKGGHHLISDELLAEGKGGVYGLEYMTDTENRLGPYYVDPNNPKEFLYAGPQPKPLMAPERIGNGISLNIGIVSRSLNTSGIGTTQHVFAGLSGDPGPTLHGSRSHGSHLSRSRIGAPMPGSRPPRSHLPGSGFPGSGYPRPV